jgi:uncharacterized protein (TIGR02996 family)
MTDDDAFLAAVGASPGDDLPRLVYADWLDERDDLRGSFLRVHLALRGLLPDHPHRPAGEAELSRLRRGLDPSWLAIAEPERTHLLGHPDQRPYCGCFGLPPGSGRRAEVRFHVEPQDTECDGWKRVCDAVEDAAADGRAEFAPLRGLPPTDRHQVITFPPTVAKLTSVERLMLYGSGLVRLPPDIGAMVGLKEFDPYTSYRLHWFPYELTRCPALADSTVSTRALYGNYKYRPPFPRLGRYLHPGPLPWPSGDAPPVRPCCVCGRPFVDRGDHRVWVSLRVATDVLPLLVNACSNECVTRLPAPAEGYFPDPHRGGPEVAQPPPRF